MAASPAVTCLRVGIGLRDVLALDVDPAEGAFHRRIQHVGDAQARLRIDRHAPLGFVDRPHTGVADVAVARQLVREAAHVAAALHVVLAAQRVHPDAAAAEIAGRHGEVGDRHDRGAALAVLGHAEPVIDRAVAAGGDTAAPRRGSAPAGTPVIASIASGLLPRFGHERRPVGERIGIAALARRNPRRPGPRSR